MLLFSFKLSSPHLQTTYTKTLFFPDVRVEFAKEDWNAIDELLRNLLRRLE